MRDYYFADSIRLLVPSDGVIVTDATIVECYECKSVTRIEAPNAVRISCEGCVLLTALDATSATKIACSSCTLLVRINAPVVTILYCSNCTSLESLDVQNAMEISCVGCSLLARINAPVATTIACSGCSLVACIEPLRMPSTSAERDLVHAIADRVAASPDALDMSCWHRCKTTHCLGGWAQVVSGQKIDESTAESDGRKLVPCLQHLFFSDDELARSELFRIAKASGWRE